MQISLAAGSTPLYCLGQAEITVIRGSVKVFGRILSSSPQKYRLYSPKSSALLFFEAEAPDQESAVLEVASLRANGLEAIQECHSVFSGIFVPDSECLQYFEELVPGFYISKTDASCFGDLNVLRIPKEWRDLVHVLTDPYSLTSAPVVFICGQRKAGKSTFSRYLLNSLLNEFESVQYVDLDPGQTELTTAGFVSSKRFYAGKGDALLGPPFTHLTLPDESVFLASSSPSEILQLYCQALFRLSGSMNSERKEPVVINMMGWMTGLGLDLLQLALQLYSPSHVVAFTAPESDDENIRRVLGTPCVFNFGQKPFALNSFPSIQYMSSPVVDGPRIKYSPSDLRNLAYWAYFFGRFNGDTLCIDSYAFSHLSALKPLVVPVRCLQLASTSREIDLFDLLRASKTSELNGLLEGLFLMRLVGLAHDPNFNPTNRGRLLNILPRNQSPSIVLMSCQSVGFIRAIVAVREDQSAYSTTSKFHENRRTNGDQLHFHILTPLSLEMVKNVNTLIIGSLNVPHHLLSADTPTLQSSSPPFFNCLQSGAADVVGSSARGNRHNLKRK